MALGVTLVEIGIAWYWWKTIHNEVRYNSLICFLMLITSGIFCMIPVLRLTFGTLLFWTTLILYIVLLLYSLYKKEMIFQALHRPEKSKIAKGIVAFVFVLMIIGSFSFKNGQELLILRVLNDYQGAFFVAFFSYAIGFLFTFTSFALLKKPEEIQK
ncbi:MAG: hypothetical protein QJR05_07550 [Thermoanaerobacterium sp.]|nr:hypothetical protein [Thermoanaerobacterium sp.]